MEENCLFFISAQTDVGINAVMLHCQRLEELNLKGLKQITIAPFLPIIQGRDGL